MNSNPNKKKHGFLWYVLMFFLWLYFFYIMIPVTVYRSEKLTKKTKTIILSVYFGIIGVGVIINLTADKEAPMVVSKGATADYGTSVSLDDIAEITDKRTKTPVAVISGCDSKQAVISDDGKSITFNTIGTFKVSITATDAADNTADVEVPVKIVDRVEPELVFTGNTEFSAIESIPVTQIASALDEIDENASVSIVSCDYRINRDNDTGIESASTGASEEGKSSDAGFTRIEKTLEPASEEGASNTGVTVAGSTGWETAATETADEEYTGTGDSAAQIATADIAMAATQAESSPEESAKKDYFNAEIGSDGKSISFKWPGEYIVTVMAKDFSDNSITDTVIVTVINDTVPTITLSEESLSIDESVSEIDFSKYAKAYSEVYGDITDSIEIDSSEVKFGDPGQYAVVYSVSDRDGNKADAQFKVSIKDTIAPEITLEKDSYSLTVGDDKPDYLEGAAATDSNDGDISGKITFNDKDVDYDKAGSYTITYEVADAAGNKDTAEAAIEIKEKPVERSAPVVEESAPVSNYILNNNTWKFHYPDCRSVRQMKEKNKIYFEGTRDEVIARGYQPCQNCNP